MCRQKRGPTEQRYQRAQPPTLFPAVSFLMTHYGHCGPTSLHFDSHSVPYFEPIAYSAPSHPYPAIMDYDYGHPAGNTSSYMPGDAFNPELYYDLQIPFPQALYTLDAQAISQTFSQQAPATMLQNDQWDSVYASTYLPNPLPLDTATVLPPSQHSESKHTRTPSAQSLDKVLPPESFSGPIPTNVETETFLRHYLAQRRPKDMAVIVPDNQPLSLSCLPDPTRGKSQPPYHLRTLTLLAIWSSPRKVLKLQEIVQSICYHFPFYTKDDKLKDSIRHMLSLQSIFVSVGKPQDEGGKGGYWTIDIRGANRTKRERKRGSSPC